MSKFVAIYYAPDMEQRAVVEPDPDALAASTQAWMDWAGRMGDHLIDLGAPLGNPHDVTHTGVSASVEAGSAAGYSFIEADDMDQATQLLHEHPHLASNPGALIQVFEVLPVPGA